MLIRLYYDDEYVEGKSDYSYKTLPVLSWDMFWRFWNSCKDFIPINEGCGDIVFLKKDCVIRIREEVEDEF